MLDRELWAADVVRLIGQLDRQLERRDATGWLPSVTSVAVLVSALFFFVLVVWR